MFFNPSTTASRTTLLDRIENTPPRRRRAPFVAQEQITTAEALWASGLSGDELEEAFDALSLVEQERYLTIRHYMDVAPVGYCLV